MEECERITIDRRISGHSKTPGGWLRSPSLDICWYRRTREEKHRNSTGIPLHGIDTATNAVETGPVSGIGIGSDATALVGSGADTAVRATDDSSADG